MPLSKKYAKGKNICTVGFSLPVDDAGDTKKLFLAGEFNAWNPKATPMRKSKGSFRANVRLEAGAAYQYRYVTDDGTWINDTEADGYVFSPYAGADNSVAMV